MEPDAPFSQIPLYILFFSLTEMELAQKFVILS
jgi:hypothetical protein